MKVYRISDRDEPRMGFYRILGSEYGGFSHTYGTFCDPMHHPGPDHIDEEPELCKWWLNTKDRYYYHFGFHYKQQLRNWINRAIDKTSIKVVASNPRFMIREYQSDDIVLFNKQCVFRLASARLVKEYDFKEVFG